MLIRLLQLVLFAIPPTINGYYPFTPNGLIPSVMGLGLAYFVTVVLPDWLRRLVALSNSRAGH